jgi:Asp-tRNA(Asn)/Glu-tRNA(Gln) amidotransferase A subunit family amidase
MGLFELIEERDPAVQAFLPEPGRRERLAAEAAALAARWPDPAGRPPLYRVAVGVKDVSRVDGLPTRAGSALPPEVFAGPQAAVVDRLRAAGALIAGKTVTAEFAALAPGPTRNPHNPAHTPGGSSSGSAAAVAAGMVPLAVGTQTVGSMIRPAAYCGVVGFKPTYGRIPVDGVVPNAPSFDTLGVFATDVAGAALAAAVLCDGWQQTPSPAPSAAPAGVRPVLGIPVGPYLQRAEPEALAALAAQVELVREAGYPVRETPVMCDFDVTVKQLFTANRHEFTRTHAEWFARYGDLYRPESVAAFREGQAVDRAEYGRALAAREEFRDLILCTMEAAAVDLWITPSATGPAPLGLDSTGSSIMCLPWSNAGLPSLSLPAGSAANGLPLGLQLVGRLGRDEQLLDWGAELAPVVASGARSSPESAFE